MRILGPFLLFAAAASAQTGFPFTNETLRYTINWPSGLSLGDAVFTAKHGATGWSFTASLDAGFPGFLLKDQYNSTTTNDLCSLELSRDVVHGNKKAREKTTFDIQRGKAQRGGGPEFDIPPCPRDALALIYYTRREMGQGRVPPAQTAYLGAGYQIRMEYTGETRVAAAGQKPEVADKLMITGKGPASTFSFEILFARDAARTPLVVRVPLTMGSFSMELAR